MKIYIAAGLTLASEKFHSEIEKLRVELNSFAEVLPWFGLGPAEPSEIFLHDQKMIQRADLVLAECSEPSLGAGYEIGYALSIGKPVMAFAKVGQSVSRMITGNTDSNFSFQSYENSTEIVELIKKKL